MQDLIPAGLIFTKPHYTQVYLKWAVDFGARLCPEELYPKGEYGVIRDDGTIQFIVKLWDTDGNWVATGWGSRRLG